MLKKICDDCHVEMVGVYEIDEQTRFYCGCKQRRDIAMMAATIAAGLVQTAAPNAAMDAPFPCAWNGPESNAKDAVSLARAIHAEVAKGADDE